MLMNRILVLVVAFFFQLLNLFGQNFSAISQGGISQIGNEFSLNNQYFIYTTIEINKKKKTFEYGFNLIKSSKPKVINFHRDNFRFLGFVKDSVILGLSNSNKIYTYNTIKKKAIKEYDFTLGDEIYSSFNFKCVNNTLYYLKESNILAYNLKNETTTTLLNLTNLQKKYSSIESFDIRNDTLAICLKVGDNLYDNFVFCLYSISTKETTLIKKGEETTDKTYSPIVRFTQYQEIVYSYYFNNEAYLHFVNYKTMGERKKQNLYGNKIINFSISGDGSEYLSLFSEKEREKFAEENLKELGIGVLLGGAMYIILLDSFVEH